MQPSSEQRRTSRELRFRFVPGIKRPLSVRSCRRERLFTFHKMFQISLNASQATSELSSSSSSEPLELLSEALLDTALLCFLILIAFLFLRLALFLPLRKRTSSSSSEPLELLPEALLDTALMCFLILIAFLFLRLAICYSCESALHPHRRNRLNCCPKLC